MGYEICVAFQGNRLIAEGSLRDIAPAAKRAADEDEQTILVFKAETSEPVEIDLRGTIADVLAKLPERSSGRSPTDNHSPIANEYAAPSPRGPGRPKLGVVAREITLLPRHWEWLAAQPGGASVALRKLVEDARKTHGSKDRARKAQEATYRFASAIAGDQPNYEDAMRALFANDQTLFEHMTQAWPADIRDHARRLSAPAFHDEPNQSEQMPVKLYERTRPQ